MATLTNYRGLQIVSPAPSAEGGSALNDNFKNIADRSGPIHSAAADPTNDDDGANTSGNGAFYLFSKWLNTATMQVFLCTDNTAENAVWSNITTGAGGSNTQIQFNDSGSLAGDTNLTFDKATGLLQLLGALVVDNLKLDGNTLSATDVNGGLIIAPNGIGAIQIDAGGNARGSRAIDFQGQRSLATQVASGAHSFVAAGVNNIASGDAAFVCGTYSTASGEFSHAEGYGTTASGGSGHAEGEETTASGENSHAEGSGALASGTSCHAEGSITVAGSTSCHAEGGGTAADGEWCHSEGCATTASGEGSHAEGMVTLASGTEAPHAEGHYTVATGSEGAHAEGAWTTASGDNAHAEGGSTIASNQASHAEGLQSHAKFYASHAFASGQFATIGDAQGQRIVCYGQTTDNTQTSIYPHAASSQRLSMDNDSTWMFAVGLVARRVDADNESAAWEIKGCIDRNANAASTAIVGSVTTTTIADDSGGTWSVTAVADTTNGALDIKVTGGNSKTIRWVAVVHLVQVTG
ncbi:hypothetical protein HED60_13840 [Planctomycetales bacterium ZRK34]|nr:hypothetical protein HED60_13840 [Planctomycetales bacterium ZRK34]